MVNDKKIDFHKYSIMKLYAKTKDKDLEILF